MSDGKAVNIARSFVCIVCLFVLHLRAETGPGATIVTSLSELQVDFYAHGTEHWTGFSTQHFRLYTNDDDGSEDAILRSLETARTFFERVGLLRLGDQSIVQIVAFGSDDEYASYGTNASADAYYQRTQNCDFIVMRDLNPRRYDMAIHEFTHFVLERSGLRLPLWLGEGLADLFSSVEVDKDIISIGKPPIGRLSSPTGNQPIPLGTLIAENAESLYVRPREQVLAFYFRSWALTHMLALGSQYEPSFNQLLSSISRGDSATDCFASVYHKTFAEVDKDLDTYLRLKSATQHMWVVSQPFEGLTAQRLSNPQENVSVVLAQLLAANPRTFREGTQLLHSLDTIYRTNLSLEESLGYADLSEGNQRDAQEHFARALELHSQNPRVLLALAQIELSISGPTKSSIDLLYRALASHPDSDDLHFELAITAAAARQFGLAFSTLKEVKNLQPQFSYAFSYALAFVYSQEGQLRQARRFAQNASLIASDRIEKDRVRALLSAIDELSEGRN